ncbi:hypothetical protein [Pseudonocardia sp. ICBG1293]|uniref:hypothetical protein n=1 Tax=Pseudonocardia sp. ICBG1293 TaxID=2844382 RepID=UPI001CCCD212|nr:hypothetical protein [Pseudonocardia sp. ICBG1293]
MSEIPSQRPRHALTDTGGTPSVPLQGGPAEVPSPARPGDDATGGPVPGEQVAVPSARSTADPDPDPDTPVTAPADTDPPATTTDPDAPVAPAPGAAEPPPAVTAAAPGAAPGTRPADDDAPTTALPVVPRPRDELGPGGRRPVRVGHPRAPGAFVPGQYAPGQYAAAARRHPSRPVGPPHPTAARYPASAQRPPARFPSAPRAQAPAVERLPEPSRPAPLPAATGVRSSGGFRLPDFPARTRPVLPVVLGAATAVVLALGVVAGVTGTSDAGPAPAPAPVSTP